MRTLSPILVCFCLAAALTASAAQGEETTPPDNSAVTQYTETFPTPRGNSPTESGEEVQPPPEEVIGQRNARRLEAEGPQGRAAAELAAATVPSAASAAPATGGGEPGNGGEGSGGRGSLDGHRALAGDSGASGLGEVVRQAFGASSGGLGVFLPLLLLAALVWAAVYLGRGRRLPG